MLCVLVALGLEASGLIPVQVERTSERRTLTPSMSLRDSRMKATCVHGPWAQGATCITASWEGLASLQNTNGFFLCNPRGACGEILAQHVVWVFARFPIDLQET